MTRDQFLRALGSLNVWRRGDERAPHKPLLLLAALGRVSREKERLGSFRELESPLRELLKRFGPPRRSLRPEFPFWHLQTDGLWEIPGGERLPAGKSGRTVSAASLRNADLQAGFPEALDRLLRNDAELIEAAAARLLAAHFPDSYHTPIRDLVGLPEPMALEVPAGYATTPRRKRDPHFRRRVLTAYERRCAICDFDIRLDDDLLGLEAAHIKWHAADGPDTVPNGLALCRLHHHALDRGAIGFEPSSSHGFHLLVSRELSGTSEAYRQLVDTRGRPLREPQEKSQLPSPAFVDWHRKQVFRGEPRSA